MNHKVVLDSASNIRAGAQALAETAARLLSTAEGLLDLSEALTTAAEIEWGLAEARRKSVAATAALAGKREDEVLA